VEYGLNEPIGLCRTEHINSHLLSVRINDKKGEEVKDENKRIAFLIDLQTIHVLDLVTGNNSIV
jgi:intraflagellar transport protein 172